MSDSGCSANVHGDDGRVLPNEVARLHAITRNDEHALVRHVDVPELHRRQR